MIKKPSPLNPDGANVAIDANALDKSPNVSAADVDRLLLLAETGKIQLIVPKGVRLEMLNPMTPAEVRSTGLSQIFTYNATSIGGGRINE